MEQLIFYRGAKKIRGEIFNAGTGDERKVRDIIEAIYLKVARKKEYNDILKLFTKNENPFTEIKSQLMHYDKVKDFFGWEPKTDFELGLDLTIEWYRKYLKELDLEFRDATCPDVGIIVGKISLHAKKGFSTIMLLFKFIKVFASLSICETSEKERS